SVALPVLVGALATLAWRDRSPRAALATPALLVTAVLLRSTIAPLALGLGVAWCLDPRPRRAWAIASGLAVLVALPFVLWNLTYLGTPLPVAQLRANANVTDEIFVWTRGQLGYGLGGLMISPGRGLLWYAPVAVFGIVRALRGNSRSERVMAAAAVLQILAVAVFHMWWGGICFGPRFLVEVTWVGIWLASSASVAAAGVTRAGLAGARVARGLGVLAVVVTLIVGQLGLWCWRAEQWETRRNPDIDQNALWDFVDSPITAMARDIRDQPIAMDTLLAPPRMRCEAGHLRTFH
nr:hypothetical protein [Deltaproteobacteria bacterium]